MKINSNYFVGNDKKNYPFAFKRIVAFVIVVAIVMSTVCSAFAAGTIYECSFYLVDTGKHLDWGGKTNYMNQFESAVETWNEQHDVIRKDTLLTLQDVTISDCYEDNSIMLCVYEKSKKIKFNQKIMDSFTSAEKEKACLCALGMALGLEATYNKKDVMYVYTSSVTSLSENDKAIFDYLYANYKTK